MRKRQHTMLDPMSLLIFAKTVECGGITASARVLGMPKATVSRAIARAEQTLSVRLLERSSRRFRVTEAGALLYQHCLKIAEEISNAEAAMAAMQGTIRGRLRIAAPYTFGHYLLSPVLGEFLSTHTDIQIDLEVTSRKVDPVEEAFDFVVRVGALDDSDMIVRTLGNVAYGLFCHEKYLAQMPEPLQPDDLSNHRLIGSFAGARRNIWVLVKGGKRFELNVGPTKLDVNDPVIRLDAVISGLGIALLPLWLVRSHNGASGVKQLLCDWKPQVDSPISLLYPDRRSLTPKSRALLSFLEHHVAPIVSLDSVHK